MGILQQFYIFQPHKWFPVRICVPSLPKVVRQHVLTRAGRGQMYMMQNGVHRIHDARALRTIWYERDRLGFMEQLEKELSKFIAYANRKDLKPAIRLNGTSDILWERTGIIEKFPDVQFYDYTKVPNRNNLPDNYHLTFSAVEDNDHYSRQMLDAGMNVAAVFEELPETWLGYPVLDGDKTDLRFLDAVNHVVGFDC